MKSLIYTACLITLPALATGSAFAESTEQWKIIDAGPFSFKAPSSMESSNVQGIDSLVGQYSNATLRLQFDYGWYSDPLKRPDIKKRPGYRERDLVVDETEAYIISYEAKFPGSRYTHMMAIHFPDVGDGRTKLTLNTWCPSTNEYSISESIFRSIQFKKNNQTKGTGNK